jgi:hypothetical protein
MAFLCLFTVLHVYMLEIVATFKLACQVEVEVDLNLSTREPV